MDSVTRTTRTIYCGEMVMASVHVSAREISLIVGKAVTTEYKICMLEVAV